MVSILQDPPLAWQVRELPESRRLFLRGNGWGPSYARAIETELLKEFSKYIINVTNTYIHISPCCEFLALGQTVGSPGKKSMRVSCVVYLVSPSMRGVFFDHSGVNLSPDPSEVFAFGWDGSIL